MTMTAAARWTRKQVNAALLVLAGVAAAAGAGAASAWPVAEVRFWLPDLLVGWAFLASGLLVALRTLGQRQGLLIGVVGVSWFLADVGLASPFIYGAVLTHAAIAMPRGRIGTIVGRLATGLGYLFVALLDRLGSQVVTGVLAITLLVVAGLSTGARRVACSLVGGLLGVNLLAHLVAPRETDEALLLAYELCLVGLACGLALIQQSSTRGHDITDVVVELGPQDALADLVRRDPAIRDDPAFASALAAAQRIRSANEALTWQLRESVDEVAASRLRLVATEDSERALLEERLQHGPLGRLDRIAATLATATSTDPGSAARLQRARDQLNAARLDLERIAWGLYPAAVADGSLESALHDISAASPVPVEIDLRVDRVEPDLAATVYFLCSEAVTNAIRHAGASRIAIAVRRGSDRSGHPRLVVEVEDDGHGGAVPGDGTGLRGMADRVQMGGGTLVIHSPAGHGTRVTASFPASSEQPRHEPRRKVTAGE